MADGDCQRIGGVRRLRNFVEIEQPRHHLLDLMFFSASVPHHRGLDRKWRVFGDFKAGRRGSKHGNSANLAKFQRGLYIRRVENIFNGNPVGTVMNDQFLQTIGDAGEACRHGLPWRNLDGATDNADQLISIAAVGNQVDDTVTGVFGAAIDAEDAHDNCSVTAARALQAKIQAERILLADLT